jgi:hypothetical protein
MSLPNTQGYDGKRGFKLRYEGSCRKQEWAVLVAAAFADVPPLFVDAALF